MIGGRAQYSVDCEPIKSCFSRIVCTLTSKECLYLCVCVCYIIERKSWTNTHNNTTYIIFHKYIIVRLVRGELAFLFLIDYTTGGHHMTSSIMRPLFRRRALNVPICTDAVWKFIAFHICSVSQTTRWLLCVRVYGVYAAAATALYCDGHRHHHCRRIVFRANGRVAHIISSHTHTRAIPH